MKSEIGIPTPVELPDNLFDEVKYNPSNGKHYYTNIVVGGFKGKAHLYPRTWCGVARLLELGVDFSHHLDDLESMCQNEHHEMVVLRVKRSLK